MALNLNRMVKAFFYQLSPPLMCHVSRDLLWNDYFVNRSLIVHYLAQAWNIEYLRLAGVIY